jgi:hypothetical protein
VTIVSQAFAGDSRYVIVVTIARELTPVSQPGGRVGGQ